LQLVHFIMEKNYFVHPSAIIDEGAIIGKGTKIWHFVHVMSPSIIGEDCNLGQNVFIANDAILGNNVKIQNNVSVFKGVCIEDDVFLGPSMVFTNVLNPRSFVNQRGNYTPTLVKKGATIGANATIVCGITIGAYSLIGAGSVVTKTIPDYALVVGNPSKQIGWVSKNGHRLAFDALGIAYCESSEESYFLKDGIVQTQQSNGF
jgi:UDP-2-acetamido-3-amino-2,3-dideoxy-glucuronate N-acetyltransferase